MGSKRELPAKYEPGFLKDMDQRTGIAIRLNAAFDAIVDDCGGADSLPHTKLALVERFVFLEAILQSIEQKIAEGAKDSGDLIGKWTAAVNSMQGLAKLIGLERVTRGRDLRAYVAEREA
jgi:hypothetical protein